MKRTKRRTAFVTGGTGSLGQALIKILKREGFNVVFQFYHNKELAGQLSKAYDVKAWAIDFTKKLELPNTKFDVIVNNSGINTSDVASHEVKITDWNRTLLINTTAPFRIIQRYLPFMMQQQWGRIINISSIYGLRGVEHNLPYNVSKHALSGLTKTIAKEYAQYGITCNEICPGPINSQMMKRIALRESQSSHISTEDYFADVCREIPAGRMANTEEIAELAAYLASESASYINGASIVVDGGMIA